MISENRHYIALNIRSMLAPAIMLALLTIAVNVTADAYVRSLGRSLRPTPTLAGRHELGGPGGSGCCMSTANDTAAGLRSPQDPVLRVDDLCVKTLLVRWRGLDRGLTDRDPPVQIRPQARVLELWVERARWVGEVKGPVLGGQWHWPGPRPRRP
jgi:hypothetical protein